MQDVSEEIKSFVAPCSLLCYTCLAYKEGIITEYALKLDRYFEGYYDFQVANLPAEYQFVSEDFKKFEEKLIKYMHRPCGGCRNNPDKKCCIKGCVIPQCTKAHGVDFCGECSEFPCQKVNTEVYSETVINRWLRGNKRIKEAGAARFFAEEKLISHYKDYKVLQVK